LFGDNSVSSLVAQSKCRAAIAAKAVREKSQVESHGRRPALWQTVRIRSLAESLTPLLRATRRSACGGTGVRPNGETGRLVLTHTEVSPELRGQGVGHELLDAAAAWSRNTGIKFILQCPFAKVLFLRDPVLREWIA
jgi:predicted GNAT family acetyltransferase